MIWKLHASDTNVSFYVSIIGNDSVLLVLRSLVVFCPSLDGDLCVRLVVGVVPCLITIGPSSVNSGLLVTPEMA
jgi:hypothetical protein